MSDEAQAHVAVIKMPNEKPNLSEYSLAQKAKILEIEVDRQETDVVRMNLVIETFKQERMRDHVSKCFLIYQTICEDKVMDEPARQIFKERILDMVKPLMITPEEIEEGPTCLNMVAADMRVPLSEAGVEKVDAEFKKRYREKHGEDASFPYTDEALAREVIRWYAGEVA